MNIKYLLLALTPWIFTSCFVGVTPVAHYPVKHKSSYVSHHVPQHYYAHYSAPQRYYHQSKAVHYNHVYHSKPSKTPNYRPYNSIHSSKNPRQSSGRESQNYRSNQNRENQNRPARPNQNNNGSRSSDRTPPRSSYGNSSPDRDRGTRRPNVSTTISSPATSNTRAQGTPARNYNYSNANDIRTQSRTSTSKRR